MANEEQLDVRNLMLQTATLGANPKVFSPEPSTYIITSQLRAVGKTELLMGLRPHLVQRNVCFLALAGCPRTAFSKRIPTIKDWVLSLMSPLIREHPEFWMAMYDGNWETLLEWLIDQHRKGLHTLFTDFKKYTWVLLDDVDQCAPWVHLLHLLAIGKHGSIITKTSLSSSSSAAAAGGFKRYYPQKKQQQQQQQYPKRPLGGPTSSNKPQADFKYRQYTADKQLCKKTVVMTCRSQFLPTLRQLGSRKWKVGADQWKFLELAQDAFHTPVYHDMLKRLASHSVTERDMLKWNRCLLKPVGSKTLKILAGHGGVGTQHVEQSLTDTKTAAAIEKKKHEKKQDNNNTSHAVFIQWQTPKKMRLPTEEIRLEIGSQVRARKTFASGQVFEGATGTVVDWQIRTSHSNVRWPIVEWHHLSSSFLTPVGSGEMWIDWNNHCNIGFGCPLALVASAGQGVENVAGLLLMRGGGGEEKKDVTEGKQEEDALLLTSLDATANGRVLSDTIDILSSVQDVRHVALLACKLSNSLFFQSEEASEPPAEATAAAHPPPPPPPAQQTSSPPSSPKRRVRRKRKRSDSVKNEDGVDAAAATGGDGDW